MKATIVMPTYADGEGLVLQAIRGTARLRLMYPDDRIRVILADDATAPLSQTPEGVDGRIATTFKRNGNLNGIECVRGLLDTYVEASLDDDDWVVKLDPDTYISHLEWIKGCVKKHVISRERGIGCSFCGASYAVTRDTAEKARLLSDRADLVERINRGKGQEGNVITCLCQMVGERKALGADEGGLHWPVNQIGNEEALRHPFITFKRGFCDDADENKSRIDEAIAVMTAFADYAEDKPVPEDAIGVAKSHM